MRAIGNVPNESAARTFSDYLYVQGIENQVEGEPDGSWAVWVHDEERLTQAREMLETFRANPTDAKYLAEGTQADSLREEAARQDRAYASRVQNRSTLFRRLSTYGLGPITFFFIVVCSVVFLWTNYGDGRDQIRTLQISEESFPEGSLLDRLDSMSEVKRGQIWRILTPMFLHFGFMHILFNIFCLRDLGSMLEARFNGLFLCLFMVVVAALSNVGQYVLHGPYFGGMSGVNYGLFGFIWMRAKFEPGSGLYLHPTTVTMMIVWFFVCFTGAVGPIANTAHTVGLLAGMLWGWLPTVLESR